MKKLESLKEEKFKNLENYKISNLAAIIGGTAVYVETGRAGLPDWSYDSQNGSDACWTRVSAGDTKTMHDPADCI